MDLFLIFLAIAWLVFASVSDLKKREVPNWLSFSLIIFAIAYRAVYAVLYSDFNFFLYGLIGLGIFVGLGYLFYYSRIFAGGDAKLLFSIGAILPLSVPFMDNLMNFGLFLFIMLAVGGIYGLLWSFLIAFMNRKAFSREFRRQFKLKKKLFYISLAFAALFLFFPIYFHDFVYILFSLIFILFPLLFVYAKAVEESGMIMSVSPSQLTEGDWLVSAVKVKGKVIKPYWEGLSSKELRLLKNYRGKVKIKVGVPFVPVFLLAFLVYLRYAGLF